MRTSLVCLHRLLNHFAHLIDICPEWNSALFQHVDHLIANDRVSVDDVTLPKHCKPPERSGSIGNVAKGAWPMRPCVMPAGWQAGEHRYPMPGGPCLMTPL